MKDNSQIIREKDTGESYGLTGATMKACGITELLKAMVKRSATRVRLSLMAFGKMGNQQPQKTATKMKLMTTRIDSYKQFWANSNHLQE